MSRSLGLVTAIAASAVIAIGVSTQPAQGAVSARASKANVTISRCTAQRIRNARDSNCQKAAPSSFSAQQRAVLDETLRLVRGENEAADAACVFQAHRWLCVGDAWICGCWHEASGPFCSCTAR